MESNWRVISCDSAGREIMTVPGARNMTRFQAECRKRGEVRRMQRDYPQSVVTYRAVQG